MTFPARLTELIEKATKGPITYSEYCSRNGAYQRLISNPSGIQKIWIGDINKECNAELIAYLVNHAEAIRDLVVAVENYLKHGTEPDCEALAQALAKLEEA